MHQKIAVDRRVARDVLGSRIANVGIDKDIAQRWRGDSCPTARHHCQGPSKPFVVLLRSLNCLLDDYFAVVTGKRKTIPGMY